MKMMNVLDMTGNQIQNLLVHNADATSNNKLPAEPGRLVYDITNRSIYFGYDNGAGVKDWARLVDTAHIESVISDYVIPKDKEVVLINKINYSGGIECFFQNSRGERLYSMSIEVVNSSNCGLLDPKHFEEYNNCVNIVVDNQKNWSQAYNWGNHASAGYAKVYKIYGGYAKDLIASGSNSNVVTTPDEDYALQGIVFDKSTKNLYAEYKKTEEQTGGNNGWGGSSGVRYQYVKSFASTSDAYNALSHDKYIEEGTCIIVNADIWKRRGGWDLIYEGASQDVIRKVDDIRNALGIGDDFQDTTPDIIDTWNEIKEYFANIDNKDQALINLIASKANDADVVKKPSTAVNGEMLIIDNGNPTWKVRKIVASNIDHDGFSGLDWVVDISELETSDVNITLYMKNATTGRYDVILADISVYETQRGSGVRRIVIIEFSADMTDKELKLVVTA